MSHTFKRDLSTRRESKFSRKKKKKTVRRSDKCLECLSYQMMPLQHPQRQRMDINCRHSDSSSIFVRHSRLHRFLFFHETKKRKKRKKYDEAYWVQQQWCKCYEHTQGSHIVVVGFRLRKFWMCNKIQFPIYIRREKHTHTH